MVAVIVFAATLYAAYMSFLRLLYNPLSCPTAIKAACDICFALRS
jgi:hypothetical protein